MSNPFENRKFILASGSPRRIEMMQNEGADFKIIKPGCEENIHLDLTPEQTVMALALRKALAVLPEVQTEDVTILSCDTVVVLGGKVIGKPKDENDAFDILSSLNGRAHEVVSGVCIYEPLKNIKQVFSCTTKVFFKPYSDSDIWAYIKTGEPMDKAGAYAIQGEFGKHILGIEGLYSNVVGFPIEMIKEKLSY